MIKMSEAMRKGAKMGPQLFNVGMSNDGGSCAYWAIIRGGVGPRHDAPTGEFWIEAWGQGGTFEEATEDALKHETTDPPEPGAA